MASFEDMRKNFNQASTSTPQNNMHNQRGMFNSDDMFNQNYQQMPTGPGVTNSYGIYGQAKNEYVHAPHDTNQFMSYDNQISAVSQFQKLSFDNNAFIFGSRMAMDSIQRIESLGIVAKLRQYFDVDNRYVLMKIIIICFPFLNRKWSVDNTSVNGNCENVSPRTDINFPDLYIPVMSFLTSALCYSVILGFNNKFSPAQLSVYMTSGIILLFFEIILFLFVFYLTGFYDKISIFQLLSLCGYKYVCISVCLVALIIYPASSMFLTIYFSLFFVFFIFRSLRLALSSYWSHNNISSNTNNRAIVLLLIGILQPVQIFWTVRQAYILFNI